VLLFDSEYDKGEKISEKVIFLFARHIPAVQMHKISDCLVVYAKTLERVFGVRL
jgi:hypothetical protein